MEGRRYGPFPQLNVMCDFRVYLSDSAAAVPAHHHCSGQENLHRHRAHQGGKQVGLVCVLRQKCVIGMGSVWFSVNFLMFASVFISNYLRNHLSLVCNMEIGHFSVFHGQKHDFF